MARAKKSKGSNDLVGQDDARAALDSAAFLAAAKPVLARLETDLKQRAVASAAVCASLTARYEAEKSAQRTADGFASWTEALATQVAAAWLLSCIFVRTLEDRGLLAQARLAGPGAEDSQKQFFQLAPSLTDRDYLLTIFRELERHPAAAALFDADHSLVWKLSPSAEVAKELLALFRAPTATAPAFRFGQPSTRFLGDLYQDLSEDVRKRYALLQTPDFVEEYILVRTLEPAIARFGLDDTTLIDPACGSGHFLLGAFDRLFEHRLRANPDIDPRVAADQALNCVYGADINPYAVAIARFRLTLSFLEKARYAKLSEAPALPLHLVVADSLRINPQHPQQELWQQAGASSKDWLGDVFALEDEIAANDVLGRTYAAVVANPPYITVKDAAVREVYRQMYTSCHRSYSLSVPFCERIFQLARRRGYTGQITANSFTKREFGKLLIQAYLPNINLEGIVNTSGAFIPDHDTPTVLLFGSNEPPSTSGVLAVLAKRGEPATPTNPREGLVWRSIVEHGEEVAFENDYISVAIVARDALRQHPWSLGGGGAAELKELLEDRASSSLQALNVDVGTGAVTREDDLYLLSEDVLERWQIPSTFRREAVIGENIRDWSITGTACALWPYDESTLKPCEDPAIEKALWPWRTQLRRRVAFGKTQVERGLPWTAYSMFFAERARTPLTITFAFVSSHNHFVLDRGGRVFNRSAPIIKLHPGSSEDEYLVLLAYLNSSLACFWMKQVFYPKATSTKDINTSKGELESNRYEFASTGMQSLPVPTMSKSDQTQLRDLSLAAAQLAEQRDATSGALVVQKVREGKALQEALSEVGRALKELQERLIVIQEDIDWIVYHLFKLCSEEVTTRSSDVNPKTRPFEAQAAGKELAVQWRGRALELSQRPELALLEQPVFKRLWTGRRGVFGHGVMTLAESAHENAMKTLQGYLEKQIRGATVVDRSTMEKALLSDLGMRRILDAFVPDGELRRLLYRFDEVPFLTQLRLNEDGLAKYKEWELTWDAQRREDAGEIAGVGIPPKYLPTDFADPLYFRMRGKLDVPHERFISYPYCESDQDGEPVYGWAGWDYLQRVKALSTLYLHRKDVEGWPAARLTPMLAGLLELIPWVKQWHNEPSEEYGGLKMGDYFEQFLDGECRLHGLTHDDLRAWRPERKSRGKARAAKAVGNVEAEEAAPKPRKTRAKKTVSADDPPPASEAD